MPMSKARAVELKYGKEGFNRVFYIGSDGRTLFWKVNRGSRKMIGKPITSLCTNGYLRVKLDGVHLLVHRVMWIMRHGDIPDGMEVNHKNLDRADNRDENHNLKIHSSNNRIKQPTQGTSSKYTGVSFRTDREKWEAKVQIDGKTKHLGLFPSEEDAAKMVYWYKAEILAVKGEEYDYFGPCCI